ncbi:MAG TPA: putative porin [Pyrinomonadaceae bacterium]
MLRLTILRVLSLSLMCCGGAGLAAAQAPQARAAAVNASTAPTGENETPAPGELDEVRRLLREQQSELERMRATITQQSEMIEELRQRVEQTAQQQQQQQAATTGQRAAVILASDVLPADADASSGASGAGQKSQADDRLGRVEEQTKKNAEAIAKQLGSITFSGDLRLRYESIYGQLNALASGDNPSVVGNELSSRQRFRIRARLNIRGQIGKEFDWGLRLGSGSYADAISNNQTLTDFYNRKPFSLDNAFVAWTPQSVPGLRLQGGKFDVPWLRTEMTIDNDLNPEGFSESYTRTFKHSLLNNLTLVAWQLPFLERASGFVRNANGTVNVDESRRAGRDLALYGAQLRARFEPTSTTALTIALADLYFSGTQFISPVQVFGTNLQLPVTIVIPATATTPAQTVTALASIPRDQLVSGNGNLGLSIASNNATNRDGRLSSGYNLVDIIGRLDLTRSKRYPVSLILDYVRNTQTHDVAIAGPGGTTLFLNNDENSGYWAEIQAGRTKERGDLAFGYTFLRIEKDAVLTPFNFSDIAQQSDVRVHRFAFTYTADPRVLLTFTGNVTQRPNGLLGVFGATPAGSLNGATTRLQFDTIFRF